MIIRGGENIAPGEIESILSEHPGIEQVKVVGVPDPHYGEEICAVIAARRSIGEDELRGRISDRLEAFKEPCYYVFTDSLPLTPGGKIDAAACRELAIADIAQSQK
jgi:acyl-CoA synthetase (AMP-forming)/AMP-acid ligase II